MPQRVINAWYVVLGIAGIVLIGVLLVFGGDIRRAMRRGPRWKRILVTAAVSLLASGGVYIGPDVESASAQVVKCYMRAVLPPATQLQSLRRQVEALEKLIVSEKTDAPTLRMAAGSLQAQLARAKPTHPGDEAKKLFERAGRVIAAANIRAEAGEGGLAETAQWKLLVTTWKQADDVATGKKGRYPFDAKGKKALLAAIDQAVKDVAILGAAKLLNSSEAELLTGMLGQFRSGVTMKRPTGMMATCYKVVLVRPAHDSLIRLVARVPILRKLAEARKLHPAAVEKVIASIEADLALLADPKLTSRLGEAERKTIANVAKTARAELIKLKARMKATTRPAAGGSAALAATREWKVVSATWKAVTPFATSGRSTTAQRKEIDGKLAEATKALDVLSKGGLFSPAEAALLTAELARLKRQVYRGPPMDIRARCYETMLVSPVRNSLARLEKRLPLLVKLVGSKRLNPGVLAKVLPVLRQDIATLSDAAQTKRLNDAERIRAAELTKKAIETLATIEKLMGAKK